MKDIKKIQDKHNKAVACKLLDYCDRNERFLSNVLLNSKELDYFLELNNIKKID